MKKLFEIPELEIVVFNVDIVTTDHDSLGDADVDFNFDDLE